MKKKHLAFHVLLFFFFFSCGRPASEKVYDPLAMFPVDAEWEFISAHDSDRIAMLIKRTEESKFTYRIELLRNWFGLPLDYGTLALSEISNDSSFIFSGGNEECKVSLKMYQSREPGGGKRVVIERICADTSKNISSSDFPPLWRKGEAHSRK